MATDPSIILSTKPVQLDSPVDTAARAYQMKDLSLRSQDNDLRLKQAKQEYDDNQAVRAAYQNNMQTNPDGSQSLNRAGVLSDINKFNPLLSAKASANFQEMDLAQMQRHMTIAKDLMFSIHDQQTLDAARSKAQQFGLPTNNIPQYYDKNLIENAQHATLDAHDQIAQKQQQFQNQIASQNAQSERLKSQASAAEAGIPYGGGASGGSGGAAGPAMAGGKAAPNLVAQNGPGVGGGQPAMQPQGFNPPPKMRQKAVNDYDQAVEGSRQRPDSLQSLKDIQSADKINEAIGQAPNGDTNKLNNNQVRLITGELVKMATGGAPTETELESLTPNNLTQKYGAMLQHMTGKSTPANAGEFIKQFQDYANGIAKQGMDRVSSRSNEIADRQRPYLGEDQYKLIKNQISNEFSGNMTRKILRLQELRAKAAGGQ